MAKIKISAQEADKFNSEASQNLKGIDQISLNPGSSSTQDLTVSKKINYDPVEMSRTKAYQKALESQTLGDIAKNAIIGAGKQAVAGAILNLAGNDPASLINMAVGNTNAEYENFLHKAGLKILKNSQEENAILQDPNKNSIWTPEYVGQQVQGLGLTMGIMAEGFAEQALFSALTASTGGATSELQAVEMAKTLSNIGKINKLKQFGFGAFQGLKEAHMNAVFTGNDVRQKYLDLGYSEEEANRIGNETATRAFRVETLPLMLINGAQFGALGHHNPWAKSAEGEFMGASGAFENLASKVTDKLNVSKGVGKAISMGVQSASEGFEEAWQDIPAAEAKYQTDKKYNQLEKDERGNVKTLQQYMFNSEMRDDAIGGAFGGIFFDLIGGAFTKGLSKFGSRNFDNHIQKAYDTLLKSGVERSIDDMTNLKKALESKDEAAISMAREKINHNQVMEALHWDRLKGDENTSMFNSRIEQMNTILKAVEDNDEETLKRYNIESQEDKDFIKENYPKFVEQSLDIKDDLEKNLAKSIDFDSASEITELNVIKRLHQNELRRSQDRITELQQSPDFQAMPTELQQYAILKVEQKALEGGKTKEQIKRASEIEEQLNTLYPEGINKHEYDLLQATDEVSSLENVFKSRSLVQDAFEKNVADIAKLSTPQGQVKVKQDRLRERINNISKINNPTVLDNILSEAGKLGMHTDELKNTIESRKQTIEAQKEVAKNVEIINEPEKNIKAVQEKVEQAKNEKAQQVEAPEIQVNDYEVIQDNLFDFDIPEEHVNDSYEDEEEVPEEFFTRTSDQLFGSLKPVLATDTTKKEQFKNSVSKLKDAFEFSGKKMDFKSLVSYYATKNFQGAEKAFEYIKIAFKENGGEVSDKEAQSVYDNIFSIDDDTLLAEMASLDDEKIADKKGIEATQKTPTPEIIKAVEIETTKAEDNDYKEEDDEEAKESVDDVDSDQIAQPTPKIPFLGIQYAMEYNPVTQKYEFVTKGEDLNREGNTALDVILNIKLFKKGTKFRLAVARDWENQNVQVWEEDLQGHLSAKLSTMSQWMESKGIPMDESKWTEEQREMWISKVPMEMWFKAPGEENEKVIGMGVHDTDWWNTRNTASFDRKSMSKGEAIAKQQALIKNGKAEALRIRKSVIEGNGEMIVTHRRQGHSTNLPSTSPRERLSQANPKASVGFIKGEQFICNSENGKGKRTINKNQIQNFDIVKKYGEGFACMLTESGTDDAGNTLYTLNMCVSDDEHFQSKGDTVGRFEQINSTLKVIEKYVRLLKKYDGKTVPESDKVLYQRALVLRDKISKLTGFNIGTFEGKAFKGFNQLKDLYPREKREEKGSSFDVNKGTVGTTTDKHLSILMQAEGFIQNGLPIVIENQDGTLTVGNYKSEVTGEEGYTAYLRDHLTTHKKFFQITDENGEKQYTTYPQPVIQYDIANPKEEESKKPETKKEDLVKDKVEESKIEDKTEEKAEPKKPVTEISHGQKQRVVNHIVSQVVKSLGSGKVKYSSIVKELAKSFEKYIDQIKDSYPEEYKYLKDNKDEILGFGKFQNTPATVREKIEEIFGEKVKNSDVENYDETKEDQNVSDDPSNIEKGLDAASYEYVVKNSLSARLKRLFMGIEKVNKESSLEEFAGIPDYWNADSVFDTLQRFFSDTSNSMDNLISKLEEKYKYNPTEFEFLKDVIERLKNSDKQLQNELLFKLNQTKNDMFFIMSEEKDGGYSLTYYDANSKEPIRVQRKAFDSNFKLSELINRVEDGFTINKEKAAEVHNIFDIWTKRGDFQNIPTQEIKSWLSRFGIYVSDKTIEDLKDSNLNGGRSFESFFEGKKGKGGLFFNLNANLRSAENSSKPVLKFELDDDSVISKNNGGYLKDLAALEVSNTVTVGTVMRIAGKNVMPFSQPNFVSEQVRKLMLKDSQLVQQMKMASFSKHSHLLDLIENNAKLRKVFNVSYVGLQAIKQFGTKNRDDLGVTDLSATDYDVLLNSFMTSKGNKIDEKVGDVEMINTKMVFPPLSDSSQMFVMDTAKLDLKASNFTFNEDGTVTISDVVLEHMFEQLVLPDLQRICDYRNAVRQGNKINIEFQEVGSQIFTILPELNTLDINGKELLRLVHEGTNTGKTVVKGDYNNVNSIISEEVKEQIKKVIQDTVLDNATSKFDPKTVSGTWVKEGLISVDEKGGLKAGPIDAKYLAGRGSENKSLQLRVATLDYVINNYIHQAQIQMLFAGDLNNYTEKPKKMFKDLNDFPGSTKSEKFFAKMDSLSSEDRKQAYLSYMELSSVNLFKRLKEQLSPGNRLAESKNKIYTQLIINDKESTSDSLDTLARLWHPEVYQSVKDDIVEFKKVESEIDDLRETQHKTGLKELEKRYSELKSKLKKALPKVADYMSITTTDGQEFTTWKEHLDCLYYQGKISEEAYKSAGKKLEAQSKELEETGIISEENKLSKEEKDVIFQPMKPLHAGMYFEKKGDYTLQRFVYVKTSSFPLTPEMTQGLKLDNIRKNIEKFEKEQGTNVRVTYRSGIKVGATDTNIDVEELYNDDYNAIASKMKDSSIQLDRENFSIQQDKPFKTDKHIEKGEEDYINMGTQIDKILFGNGINKIEEEVFPNLFDNSILSLAGIEPKEMLSGKDLYKISNAMAIHQQENFKTSILEELGVDVNTEWYNSVDTLSKIQNLLDNRLSNYQDREIIRLNYKVDEGGIAAYYTKEELKSREKELGKKLKVIGAEFDIPIWISPNSQKFESVLNSIINNRTVKLKLPGSSSPVGSQEGFRMKKSDVIPETGVIFTPSFDPATGLKATTNPDGTIKTAQVLLPAKYRVRTKEGDKLIDLRDYTKVVDGRTVLDMDRVDKNLLTMFSFRIPTSSHQSGSTIEVVGFLPHEAGDLMIVPKDHVTQIGEDFDIDVRYYYRQHYVVKDGKISVLKESDIPETTKAQRDKLYKDYKAAKDKAYTESKIELKQWVADKKNMYQLAFAEMDLEFLRQSKIENQNIDNDNELENFLQDKVNNLSLMVKEDNDTNRTDFEDKLREQLDYLKNSFDRDLEHLSYEYISVRAVEALKQKLIENNQISLYKSIYSSAKPEVQRRINATLSTDFAKDTANLIDKTYKGKSSNKHFSVLDDRVQKEALRLGASGKLGIGVHSNWVVFNSLLQQQEKPVQLFTGKNEKKEPIFLDMVIGDFSSDGKLGMINTLDGKRTIATVNMENQNCSTDNQKLQVMGKRNENKYTINVFSLLCNLGFDTGKTVDGKELHIPSLFVSQPILKRYVELQEDNASIFSDFNSDAEGEIIRKLKSEFGEGVQFYIEEGTETNLMDNEQYKQVSTELTTDNLVRNMSEVNNQHQWAVLQKFLQLKGLGAEVNKVQRLLNIEKDGLGISVFNTVDKKDSLIFDMFSGDIPITNAESLFGKRESSMTDEKDQELLNEGYTLVYRDDENNISYFMKPTTAQNAKLINSLSLGYNLWSKVFPFENKFIKEQINTILNIMGVEKGTSKELETKYKILSAIKDFAYSYNNGALYDVDAETDRKKLTIDTKDNISLASYLNELKNQKHPLFEEPFFQNLEFDIFSDGKKPSLIKYTSSANSALNKNDAHTALERLVGNNTPVGVKFNGKDYTYNDLIKDITKYAMLADQENGAIGFRNYIPMAAFKKFGIDKMLKRIADTNSNHFNLLLNGEVRAVMNLAGVSYFDQESGLFYDMNLKRSMKEKSNISSLIYNINEKYGFEAIKWDTQNGVFIVNGLTNEDFTSKFVEQYFQHNPEETKKYSWAKKKEWIIHNNSDNLNDLSLFSLRDVNNTPDYISIKKPKSSGYALFKHLGYGNYQRINTLGGFGMNEYSPLKSVKSSIYDENNKIGKKVDEVKPVVRTTPERVADIIPGTITQVFDKMLEGTNPEYKDLMNLLKPFLGNVEVILQDDLLNQGIEGVYSMDGNEKFAPNTIYLNRESAKNLDSKSFQETVIEEALHSISHNTISEWLGDTNIRMDNGQIVVDVEFKQDGPRPYYITKLVDLYRQAVQAVVSNSDNVEDGMAKLQAYHKKFNALLGGNKVVFDASKPEDFYNNYRVFNIHEFIAGVFVDPIFRDLMSKTSYKGTEKTLLSEFKDFIKRLIKTLSNNTVDDSLLEHSIDTVFAILNKKEAPSEKSEIKEKTESVIQKAEDLIKNNSNFTEENSKEKEENSMVNYNYYGQNIEVTLDESGKAIDVNIKKSASETNVKFEERKQRIIDAYNNNNGVNPQVVEAENKARESSKELDEQIKKSKEEAEKGSATFTFRDGTTIKTGNISLNPQQREALQAMADFYDSEDQNFFTLKGYAGTGKTTIMKFLMQYIEANTPFSNITFSSPTHRANAVLKKSLGGRKVITLHKAFGLSPELDLDEFDAKSVKFNQDKEDMISYGGTLIIDESSMINDDLFEFIEDAAKSKNVKVLFMGDPAQLRPVKQEEISKVFTKVGSNYELTKVERTGNNPLLAEVTNIRNSTNSEVMSMTSKQNAEGEGVTFMNEGQGFLQSLADRFTSDEFKDNPLLARFLSYTNARVDEANKALRKFIWGDKAETEYNVGEILMGYANFDINRSTKEPKISNSGDYRVVHSTSEMVKEEVFGPNKEKVSLKGYELTLEDLNDPKKPVITVFMLSRSNPASLFTQLGRLHEEIRFKSIADSKVINKGAAWAPYYDFKKAFATPENLEYRGAVKVSKTLDYGYAHTIHKSQGGTYKYIYVDSRDIYRAGDAQLEKQLKYVALSRAQQHAYVITNKEVKQAKEAQVLTEEDKIHISDNLGESMGSLKPSFESLFTKGYIESQGFRLTLDEFNSLSEEEQENFKNCL